MSASKQLSPYLTLDESLACCMGEFEVQLDLEQAIDDIIDWLELLDDKADSGPLCVVPVALAGEHVGILHNFRVAF